MGKTAKKPTKKWTADEVKALLHDYYSASDWWRQEWLAVAEMELPAVNELGGNRRIDFLAVNLWWGTRGFQVVGHEIKVSRADWLNELSLFGKADETARYCTAWCIVCPRGIVQEGELPEGWGLMEVVGKGKVRRNVTPEPREAIFDREFAWRLMHKATKTHVQALRDLESKQRESQTEDVEERVREVAKAEEQRAEKAEAKLQEIRTVTGLDLGRWGEIQESDVKAAREMSRLLRMSGGVRKRILDQLEDLRDEVAKFEKALA
jgi:hypothetical protein